MVKTLEQVENTEETPPTGTEDTTKPEPLKPEEETLTEDKTPTLRESPEFIAELAKAQGGWDRRNKLLEVKLTQSQAQGKEVVGKHEALVAEREADTTLSKTIRKFVDSGGNEETVEALSKALREVNKTKAEAEKLMKEAVQEKHDIFMGNKILEASRETGLPVGDFDECENEYDIIIKAQQYQIDHPPKPKEKKKVDSATGIGTGIDVSKMTPEDKVNLGFKQKFKQT